MHCSQCGTENSSDSAFCIKCGASLSTTQNQKIWNPSTVAGLSFVFSPAFGSYLLASNWKALGKPEKAASSKVWFLISLVFLVVLAGLSVVFAGNENSRGIVNGVAIVYFIVWYSLSGRLQVKHVKETFGKKFAKRSFVKPVLIGSVLLVAYVAIVIGLLIATHGAGGDEDQVAGRGQATTSSGGPMSSIASLLPGSSSLSCAAPEVKRYMSDTYGALLINSGIPDLILAVQDNRVKVHVDAIHETSRNDESKNIDCASNLVIEFSKDDLKRATQQGEVFAWLMQSQDLSPITDATFTAPITYQVATSSDAGDQKRGPIVTLTTKEDAAVGKRLQTYMAYYQVLSYSAPDITASSANTKPWDKDYMANAIQSCSKASGLERCTCRLDAFEKVIGEQDMERIGFTMLTNVAIAAKYSNFTKLANALKQQCPVTQSLATILGEQGAAADFPATATAQTTTTAASEATPQSAVQTQQAATSSQPEGTQSSQQPKVVASTNPPLAQPIQPTQLAIVASFDCAKASSYVEKEICSDATLGRLDSALADNYNAMLATNLGDDGAGLKKEQRAWLVERNKCETSKCLVDAYRKRVDDVCNDPVVSGVHASCVLSSDIH